MKKTILLFMALCLLPGLREVMAQTNGNTVHLKGQLIEMGSTSVPMYFNGAASFLGDSRDVFIETDKLGFFDITIPLTEPTYFNICRNTLYLTPGDDMTIKITQNNKEATFEGRGAEVNRYMRFRLFPHGGSFLEGGDNMRKDFESTRTLIDSLAHARRLQLAAVKEASEAFKQMEAMRIEADVLNSYISYPGYYTSVFKVSKEELKTLFDGYVQKIAPIAIPMVKNLNSDKALEVAVARDVLSYLTDRKYADWKEGTEFTPRLKEMCEAEQYVRELRQQVTPKRLETVNRYMTGMQYEDFRTEVMKKVEEASRLMPGKPAFDIEMTDKEGNPHKLSELKGQLLYVDLWATWCGPCCAESPYFESLSKEFVGKEIRFVPISTDKHRQAWLGYLTQHKKELFQYNTVDTCLSTEWKVYGIPRFLLIDKDFNIINAYAPRPSEEGTKALLESLLK